MNRREERAQLRAEREKREAEAKRLEKRRLTAAYAGAGFLVVILVAAAVFAFSGGGDDDSGGDARVSLQSGQTNGVALDERAGTEPPLAGDADLAVAARQAGCEVRAKLPIEGRSHLPADAAAPKYKTNPPTSGNHVEPPYQQADGAYAETPAEADVVHALEHGRLALQYSPAIAPQEQLALRGLYDSAYSAALLFPNDRMPYEVAASSWGELIGCEEYRGAATLDAIRAFGAKYQGTAPEPLAAFGPLAGPTFAAS